MRKFMVLAMLMMTSVFAFGQVPGSSDEPINKRMNFGVIGGCVGPYDKISVGAVGMNATIYGFYFDFFGWTPLHSRDTRTDKWVDNKSVSCHVGYQIPVCETFRITPVIGYSYCSNGVTDGSNWYYSYPSIENSYYEKERMSGFDYGAVATININRINIYVAGTRHALYGGIGFEL